MNLLEIGEQRGLERGLERGRELRQTELLLKMLEKGLSCEEIARLTEVPLGEIEKLKKDAEMI